MDAGRDVLNKRQKLILSLIFVLFLLLALIGITYAYFLTRIIGNNTTDKSVEGTLGELEIEYKDGNGLINNDNMMIGDTLVKTFTVENTGTLRVGSYKVIFENVVNPIELGDGLVYTLTCESSKNIPCNGASKTNFPKSDADIVTNSIGVGEIQTYTLTVTYEDNSYDQSDYMGASFQAKVNIE